jgi:Co/Zn/Cd efflux system component
MDMHDHESHTHAPLSARALRYSLLATFVYVLVTLVAGLRAHSLALLSEAGHNLTDLLALLLSWVAVYIQSSQRHQDLWLSSRRRAGSLHQRAHAGSGRLLHLL